MHPKTKENLQTKLVEHQIRDTTEFVTQIEKFLLTQEAQYLHVKDDAAFDSLIGLFGHDSFDFSKVRAYSYESNSSQILSVLNENAGYKGKGSLHTILSKLGDIGINLEFCNDFRVRVVVDLDSETSVFYDYQSFEAANVCNDCSTLEQYHSIHGSSRFYSCDHRVSDNSSRYYAVLHTYIPTQDLDRALVHGEM